MDFAVPTGNRVKLKESEKRDMYQDVAREVKKLWNMKVTAIPVVIDEFERVTKGLVQGLEDFEIRGRVETIQTEFLSKLICLEAFSNCNVSLPLRSQPSVLLQIFWRNTFFYEQIDSIK